MLRVQRTFKLCGDLIQVDIPPVPVAVVQIVSVRAQPVRITNCDYFCFDFPRGFAVGSGKTWSWGNDDDDFFSFVSITSTTLVSKCRALPMLTR
jgi:hypothetical protein